MEVEILVAEVGARRPTTSCSTSSTTARSSTRTASPSSAATPRPSPSASEGLEPKGCDLDAALAAAVRALAGPDRAAARRATSRSACSAGTTGAARSAASRTTSSPTCSGPRPQAADGEPARRSSPTRCPAARRATDQSRRRTRRRGERRRAPSGPVPGTSTTDSLSRPRGDRSHGPASARAADRSSRSRSSARAPCGSPVSGTEPASSTRARSECDDRGSSSPTSTHQTVQVRAALTRRQVHGVRRSGIPIMSSELGRDRTAAEVAEGGLDLLDRSSSRATSRSSASTRTSIMPTEAIDALPRGPAAPTMPSAPRRAPRTWASTESRAVDHGRPCGARASRSRYRAVSGRRHQGEHRDGQTRPRRPSTCHTSWYPKVSGTGRASVSQADRAHRVQDPATDHDDLSRVTCAPAWGSVLTAIHASPMYSANRSRAARRCPAVAEPRPSSAPLQAVTSTTTAVVPRGRAGRSGCRWPR